MPNRKKDSLWKDPSTYLHPLLALLLAIGAGTALYCSRCDIAFVVIVFADLYLLGLLILAALRSDGIDAMYYFLPRRTPCVFAFGLLLPAILCSFAVLYQMNGGVDEQQMPKYVQRCPASENCTELHIDSVPLKTRMDAVYFSAVTITTLGYGDYTPATPTARGLVLWDLGTGALMLIILFPLLVCRIAVFEESSVAGSCSGIDQVFRSGIPESGKYEITKH
jgi:hypothetical protein